MDLPPSASSVKILVARLNDPQANGADKTAAALEIWEACTQDEGVRQAVIECGAISPLLSLCSIPKKGNLFPVNFSGLSQVDQCTEAALGALACVSMEEEACRELMRRGSAPLMLSLLSHPSEAVQESAAGVLTNVTSVPGFGLAVAKAGAIPLFTRLLSSRSEECREAAAGALRNIAADSDDAKHMIADHEACIRELVRLLGTGRPKIQLNAVEALVNLTSDQSCREMIAEQGGIAPLVMLVGLGLVDEDLKEMAARALAGLAAEELNRQYIARAGGLRFLMDLLADEGAAEGARAGAAMALANLSINVRNRATVAHSSFLPTLAGLLGSGGGGAPRGTPIREACKMLWMKLEADTAIAPSLRTYGVQLLENAK